MGFLVPASSKKANENQDSIRGSTPNVKEGAGRLLNKIGTSQTPAAVQQRRQFSEGITDMPSAPCEDAHDWVVLPPAWMCRAETDRPAQSGCSRSCVVALRATFLLPRTRAAGHDTSAYP